MTQEPTSLLPIWARTPTTRRAKSRRHQLPISSDAMAEAHDHRPSSTAGRPFLSGLCAAALRRKPLGAHGSAAATGEGLVRQLGVLELVLLGIGASIGAGIFVVTGTVARDAGPVAGSQQASKVKPPSGRRQLAARAKPPRPWGSGGRHRSSKEHRRPAAAQTDWNNKQTEGRGPLMERGKREDGDSLPVVNWVKWWCQVVDVKTISWMLSMQRCSDAWLDCKSASSNRLGSNSHILTYVYLYGALHTYTKIASETDILILQMQISIMDANKVQIKDNAVQTVEIEKDEDPMRADEDVMAMPQYNKPKKANNAKVMPQDYECTQEDAQVIEYMKGQDKETVLVRIGDAWIDRDDMDCLFLDDVQVNNGAVISTYIQLMRHEEHLLHREGGNVYMENSFITQLLKRDGATDATTFDYSKDDKVQTWVQKYLDADMVFLPVNIVKFHWYLAVVNASKCEVYVLDSLGETMSNLQDLEYTLIGMERLINVQQGIHS